MRILVSLALILSLELQSCFGVPNPNPNPLDSLNLNLYLGENKEHSNSEKPYSKEPKAYEEHAPGYPEEHHSSEKKLYKESSEEHASSEKTPYNASPGSNESLYTRGQKGNYIKPKPAKKPYKGKQRAGDFHVFNTGKFQNIDFNKRTGAFPHRDNSADQGVYTDGGRKEGGYPYSGSKEGGYPYSGSKEGGYPYSGNKEGVYTDSGMKEGGSPYSGIKEGVYTDSGMKEGGYPYSGRKEGVYTDSGSKEGGYPYNGRKEGVYTEGDAYKCTDSGRGVGDSYEFIEDNPKHTLGKYYCRVVTVPVSTLPSGCGTYCQHESKGDLKPDCNHMSCIVNNYI